DASGTNAGVRTSPCARRRTPARAFPARASISNGLAVTPAERSPRAACFLLARGLLHRALLGGGALDGRLPAVRRARLDLDPARLALLRLRDLDLEHPLLEPRGHRVRIDPLRKRQRAAEVAGGPLDVVPALLALLVVGLALA